MIKQPVIPFSLLLGDLEQYHHPLKAGLVIYFKIPANIFIAFTHVRDVSQSLCLNIFMANCLHSKLLILKSNMF